jgi:hypothetical protein
VVWLGCFKNIKKIGPFYVILIILLVGVPQNNRPTNKNPYLLGKQQSNSVEVTKLIKEMINVVQKFQNNYFYSENNIQKSQHFRV